MLKLTPIIKGNAEYTSCLSIEGEDEENEKKWRLKMNYKIIIISILIDNSDQNLLQFPSCLIIILILIDAFI